MPKERVVAFDMDRTLLRGQSGTLILRYLMKRHLMCKRTITLCSWWGIRYKLRLPYRQNEPRERIFNDLSSNSPEDILAIMKEFHDQVMIDRYRPEGVERLRAHVRAGDHVVLVSATFDQVARIAREYLGCEASIGTIMEKDANGHFTGSVAGETPAGEEKVRRITQWADEAFGQGNWEVSDAYGDHSTDVPMLSMARIPHAVNPDLMLSYVAKQHNWDIIKWR